MALKIYTKTGDKGETSLFGGKRVLKSNQRVDTYGTVDELNSMLGVAISEVQTSKSKMQNHKEEIKRELLSIQHDLFAIGASLANPASGELPYLSSRVIDFEKLIDDLTESLPELRNFILPGGGKAGAQLHMARTICRRAERRVVALSQEEPVDPNIRQYFNRLSDLLFTMARFVNHQEEKKETIWGKRT